MINPTPCDAALENWFLSNGEDAVAAPDQILNSVAPWIPLIGIPANDA